MSRSHGTIIPSSRLRDLVEVFSLAMDRELKELLPFPDGPVLNLGAGPKLIPDTIPFDADRGWLAGERLPFADGEVAGAYAFHFFEHLAKAEIISVTRELERILKPGGSFITVTPHWSSELAHHDIDHKTSWAETTWHNIFATTYTGRDGSQTPQYAGTMNRDWKLRVHTAVIMGVVHRNLVTVTQIVKVWPVVTCCG